MLGSGEKIGDQNNEESKSPKINIQDAKINEVKANVVIKRMEIADQFEPLRKLIMEELERSDSENLGIEFFEDRVQEIIENIGLDLKNIDSVFYDEKNFEFLKNNKISSAPENVGGFLHQQLKLAFIRKYKNIPKFFEALLHEMTAVHEIAHGNEVMKNLILKEFYCVDKESLYVQEILKTKNFKMAEEKKLITMVSTSDQGKITENERLVRVLDPVEVYKIFGPFIFGKPKVSPGLENVKEVHSSNSYAILNLIQFLSKIDLMGYIRKHGDKDYCEPKVFEAISNWDQEIAELMSGCTNYEADSKHLLLKIFLRIWEKYKKYLQEAFSKGNYPDPKSAPCGCVEAINFVLAQNDEQAILDKKLKEKQLKRTRLLNQQKRIHRH